MPREPPTEVPRSEPVTLLRQTLALLQPEAAQAAVYYFLDGMTHEEIAHVMGCSRRHVGDVLDRTIRFLKTQESNDGIQTRTRQA
jgi:RNA polymerase sigma-70 factor (ECF subfamily)